MLCNCRDVLSNKSGGTLIWKNERYEIPKDEIMKISKSAFGK
jgi:hypothetical protein